MLCGEAICELVTLLQRREACLWHACNFQDFCAYLMLGGVPFRAVLEQSSLRYTGFTTDEADHANGVWDKVFVNLSDFGEGFARGWNAVPNAYGPIVLQIKPAALVDAEEMAVCLHSAAPRATLIEKQKPSPASNWLISCSSGHSAVPSRIAQECGSQTSCGPCFHRQDRAIQS